MIVIEGIVGDVVRGVSRAVGGAVDVTADVGSTLGVDVVTSPAYEALRDAWDGPVKDFAHTDAGKTLLRAMATGAYVGLVPVLGPQLAAISFAWPGLVRGERLDVAWLTEFSYRLEKTAEILGADVKVKLGDMLGRVLGQIQGELSRGNRELLTWSAEQVADHLSVPRVDVVAAALALVKRSLSELGDAAEWDPVTGARRSSLASRAAKMSTSARSGPLVVARSVALSRAAEAPATAREIAFMRPATPATVAERAASSPSSRLKQDALLGGVIVAAIVAVVWWRRGLSS